MHVINFTEMKCIFNKFLVETFCLVVWHTGIPGLWTQELDVGLWTLDSERWTLDAVLWTLGSGRWTLDSGRWTLDGGGWAVGSRHYL